MVKMEFFFDCSSPWTSLAFSRIQSIIEKYPLEVIWKPILVGGVFNEVNDEIYAQRSNPNPLKFKYSRKDMQDWAELSNIIIKWPSIFPVSAVKMMRIAIIAIDEDCLVPFATKCFKSYWEEDEDVSNDIILKKIILSCGMDDKKVFDLIQMDEIKNKLKSNTSNLIERGGFGSPTIFLNDHDMYFGNDRLELIDYKLGILTKNF